MIIEPKIRGFVCITAHPEGCAEKVAQEIAVAKAAHFEGGPKKVLVIGASTGYGLSSRITSAFTSGADTLGVFFERPSINGKPASAGWYNTVAFEKEANAAGLYAKSINGDAFSNEIKDTVVETIKQDLGKVDCVIYSLASPKRIDPADGTIYKSCLKPIGSTFNNISLDTNKGEIQEVSLEPATDDDIHQTVKVMGGDDWELWMEVLAKNDLLASDCKTVAYSYIGPEVTWPIYKNGTIGVAKLDLDRASKEISNKYGLESYVSVNKAVVTQASSAIPVVPLYISILYKIMNQKGTHEGCIEQIVRLFKDRLYGESTELDSDGRIRVDDWEMDPEVQQKVADLWPQVTSDNLRQLTDFNLYQKEFLELFGFGLESVDYSQPVEVDRPIKGLITD
ncbi:MAG: enoyl-[acyl-carrier-protein] reductase FabV [Puniceicoccaceae bacterium]|nr:enoyl-[acyl-carrier-protein] reductase FabV [Puniceicoccaceae bacterium]RCL30477.1 MAG: trans-2-enoyl-CoA reductase family protein [Puniceicoccaceae bacterium]